MKLIKHENIIELKDFFEDKQYIYFITEFYEGGDLLTYLEEKQKIGEQISEKTCAKIIRKIAQGIQYLNLFGIVHRDLKPENIMFARHYNFKTIKLIDLGVCKTLTFGEKAKERRKGWPVEKRRGHQQASGRVQHPPGADGQLFPNQGFAEHVARRKRKDQHPL